MNYEPEMVDIFMMVENNEKNIYSGKAVNLNNN